MASAAPEAGTPWHLMTRPVRVERPDPSELSLPPAARPSLYEGEVEPGLAALCRGAGIEARSLPPEARAAAMQLAGQLLREAVLGLMDLQQGRSELRNRLGVAAGATEESASPLKLSQGGVQDILVRLLSRVSARAGSVDAMREKFRDQKAQNAAMVAAMQAALSEVLARFAPQELEERFQRTGRRGVFGAPDKGKYWDLYAELYASLTQRTPDGFPHLFAEAFAREFEGRMRELAAPRRSGLGGEA
jgi:type VI secretion system protein